MVVQSPASFAKPARDVTLVTELEQGTWLNGTRIHLDAAQDIGNEVVAVEINRFQTDEERAWACRLAQQSLAIRSLSTAVGNIVELLSGCTALYVNSRGGKIWDFATGALAVKEAHGAALGCDGSALEWSQTPMSVMLAVDNKILETARGLRNLPSGD